MHGQQFDAGGCACAKDFVFETEIARFRPKFGRQGVRHAALELTFLGRGLRAKTGLGLVQAKCLGHLVNSRGGNLKNRGAN